MIPIRVTFWVWLLGQYLHQFPTREVHWYHDQPVVRNPRCSGWRWPSPHTAWELIDHGMLCVPWTWPFVFGKRSQRDLILPLLRRHHNLPICMIQMFLQGSFFNFPLPSQVRSMILIQRMYYQLLHHGAILKFKEYKATKEPIFYVLCLQGYDLHTFNSNPCRYQYCIVYPAFLGACEAVVNLSVIILYQSVSLHMYYVYIILYRLCMYDSLSADFMLLGPGRIAIWNYIVRVKLSFTTSCGFPCQYQSTWLRPKIKHHETTREALHLGLERCAKEAMMHNVDSLYIIGMLELGGSSDCILRCDNVIGNSTMGKKQLVKKSHSGYGKNPSFSGFQHWSSTGKTRSESWVSFCRTELPVAHRKSSIKGSSRWGWRCHSVRSLGYVSATHQKMWTYHSFGF